MTKEKIQKKKLQQNDMELDELKRIVKEKKMQNKALKKIIEKIEKNNTSSHDKE